MTLTRRATLVGLAVTAAVFVAGQHFAHAQDKPQPIIFVLDRAKVALPGLRVSLADLYAGVHAAYPDEHRYAVDNMWTHAPIEELLPGLRRIAESMPPAPSHMLWMNWGQGAANAGPARPDMAYSVEDDTYVALYAVWQDPGLDADCVAWATGHIALPRMLRAGLLLDLAGVVLIVGSVWTIAAIV